MATLDTEEFSFIVACSRGIPQRYLSEHRWDPYSIIDSFYQESSPQGSPGAERDLALCLLPRDVLLVLCGGGSGTHLVVHCSRPI